MRLFPVICGAVICGGLISACERDERKPSNDSGVILTPPSSTAPRINNPKVVGVRPRSPFLFQIAATGERPMEFGATDLPNELSLDSSSGQITGTFSSEGEHLILLSATNRVGRAEKTLRIIVGEEIALTPPMGWNSWNCWGGKVTQERVLAAARVMATSGLRDHGWSYANIDDGWQGVRGGEFNAIQPNKSFTSVADLSQEIHALGLKFGIYSTPWRTSFYGQIGSSADYADGSNEWIRRGLQDETGRYKFPQFESALNKFAWLKPLTDRLKERQREKITKELRTFGKFSFVRQDVAQWNAWGVDYLKYDWIPIDIEHTREMRDALRGSGRDIVFSVANNAAFTVAPELSQLANSWRTSGDVKDNWRDVSKTGFTRDRWGPFSHPGHYNDPDMLAFGYVGWGKSRLTNLSPNEQYTQMSLWCLLSAPLLLGCDLEKLDAFMLGLITNDEVIEIDQDSLGKQATRVAKENGVEILAKPLEDGSWAIGFFNIGTKTQRAAISWSKIGELGKHAVRDLWRQQDLGVFADQFETSVPPHGVVLVRLRRVP